MQRRACAVGVLLCYTLLLTLLPADTTASSKSGSEHKRYRVDRETVTLEVESIHDYYTLEVRESDTLSNRWLEPDESWTSANAPERSYITTSLSFSFPFYGSPTRELHIASGGFLSITPPGLGVSVSSYYIAPLLADLKGSPDSGANIFYLDRGNSIVIQWRDMVLANNQSSLPFSFQATLSLSGDIQFIYNQVPVNPENITVTDHPVEVGLADSYSRLYYLEGRETYIRYDYHSIDVPLRHIRPFSRVAFSALPTCQSFKDCSSCLNHETVFDCGWCEDIGLCSDGVDRFREQYLEGNCHQNSLSGPGSGSCPADSRSLYQFVFNWEAPSFDSSCWYWLGVRINRNSTELQDRVLETVPGTSRTTVSFTIRLFDNQFSNIYSHLSSNTPLFCSGGALDVNNVQASQIGSNSLSTQSILVIVSGCVLAIVLVAVFGTLYYGYTHPTSSLGQWMIAHRQCRGFCGSPYADHESTEMQTRV